MIEVEGHMTRLYPQVARMSGIDVAWVILGHQELLLHCRRERTRRVLCRRVGGFFGTREWAAIVEALEACGMVEVVLELDPYGTVWVLGGGVEQASSDSPAPGGQRGPDVTVMARDGHEEPPAVSDGHGEPPAVSVASRKRQRPVRDVRGRFVRSDTPILGVMGYPADTVTDRKTTVTDRKTTVTDRSTDRTDTVADRSTDRGATVADRSTDRGATVTDRSTDRTGTVTDRSTDRKTTVADRTDTVTDRTGTVTDRSTDRTDTITDRSTDRTDTVTDRTGTVTDRKTTVTDRSTDRTGTVTDRGATVADRSTDRGATVTDRTDTVTDRSTDRTDTVTDRSTDRKATVTDRKTTVADRTDTVTDRSTDRTGTVTDRTGTITDRSTDRTDTVTDRSTDRSGFNARIRGAGRARAIILSPLSSSGEEERENLTRVGSPPSAPPPPSPKPQRSPPVDLSAEQPHEPSAVPPWPDAITEAAGLALFAVMREKRPYGHAYTLDDLRRVAAEYPEDFAAAADRMAASAKPWVGRATDLIAWLRRECQYAAAEAEDARQRTLARRHGSAHPRERGAYRRPTTLTEHAELVASTEPAPEPASSGPDELRARHSITPSPAVDAAHARLMALAGERLGAWDRSNAVAPVVPLGAAADGRMVFGVPDEAHAMWLREQFGELLAEAFGAPGRWRLMTYAGDVLERALEASPSPALERADTTDGTLTPQPVVFRGSGIQPMVSLAREAAC